MSELILFFPQNLQRNITSQINSRQVVLALLEVRAVDEKWKSAAQPQVSLEKVSLQGFSIVLEFAYHRVKGANCACSSAWLEGLQQ